MAERVEQDPHSDRRDRHEPLERGHGLRVSRCGGNGPVSAWPVSVGTLVLAVALLGAEGVAEAQQAAATPPATPAPARSRLAAVTLPDLGTLESEVATQISGVHKDLEALRAKDTVSDAELGESYGMLGQLLHAYELFEPASLCYGNALLLTPGEYRWLHLRGDAEKRRGNLAEARPLLQAAAELRPREVASLVSVGEVALELNDMALAKRAFTQALSVAPGLPAALAGLGQVAVVEQDYPAAVAYLEGALRAVPEANRLHYPLALAYRALGKVDEARQHMEQRGSVGIRVLDPLVDELKNLARGERFHALRARLLFGNGLYAEAAKEFVAAVQLNPQSVPSLINLGVTLARLGDNASAIERLRQALALAPENLVANFNLGQLLAAQGRHSDALPHLQVAADGMPEDAEANRVLAQSLAATGQDEAALTYFTTAYRLNPNDEETVLGGVTLLVRLGRFKPALEILEAAHQRMPEQGRTTHTLAYLLAASPTLELRNGARAFDLAKQVYDAQPGAAHARTVALALAELGRCKEAARWQRQVVEAAGESDAVRPLAELLAEAARYRSGPPCRPPWSGM